LLPTLSSGQPETAEKNTPPANREQEIQQKNDALQNRIKVSVESETPETAQIFGVTLDQLKERSETLQELQTYYNRQLISLGKERDLANEMADLEKKILSGEVYQLEQTAPYTINFYDDYSLKHAENIKNKQNTQMALTIVQKTLDNANTQLKDTAQQLRTIKSESPASKTNGEKLALEWQTNKAERESDLAQATKDFHDIVLQNSKKRLELADKRVSITQKNLFQIRENLSFPKSDLEKQLGSIDERKTELLTELNELIKKVQKQEIYSVRAQKKIDNAGSEEEKTFLKTNAATIDLWRKTYQKRLEHNEILQQVLDNQKQLWKKRYDLIQGDYNKADLNLWKNQALDLSKSLQKNITLEQNQQISIQLQLASVDDKLAQANIEPPLLEILQDQKNGYKKMAANSFTYLTTVSSMDQFTNRFIDEIDFSSSEITFWDHAAILMAKVPSIWHFELFVVDDQSVTIGKIILALILLIFGIFTIGQITRLFQRRVLKKTKMSPSSAAITEKLIYYTLFLFILLWAMNIVNIPLTAFTFLGGAVAIGVGFGAQKLFNNFISGFILMAEQPIKVGDLIQLDNELGWIDDIGVRSTRVRTYSNINILVPNSYFLENNIINWTHTDNIVRCQVPVGVVYGSDVEKVKTQLLKAAETQSEILKNPDPYVFFTDFGDNALIFNLFFWLSVSGLVGRQRIESEVRFIIERLFREAGIVVAFPQRDMHLDTIKPLQVEIINPLRENTSVAKQEDKS
jgi:small-conductance mechanosensitive channel